MCLHPNMYLLIRIGQIIRALESICLHPNMYLLIPVTRFEKNFAETEFTSQHVSINSEPCDIYYNAHKCLHPNMYLLIPLMRVWYSARGVCLHPNMYLLIPCTLSALVVTFASLHPNMYLLIPVYRILQSI